MAHAKERTLHTLGLNKFQKLEAIAFTNIAVYLFELRNVLRSYGVWAFQQAFERYFPQGTAEPLSKYALLWVSVVATVTNLQGKENCYEFSRISPMS